MKNVVHNNVRQIWHHLKNNVRFLRNKLAQTVPILLYHRVAKLATDPQLLSVLPENFATHLKTMRRIANPISLQQLLYYLENGNLPERSVVVTFDDGYIDNLHFAKPLLDRFDVPATVFVTTGMIGKTQEFWWDELERLLLLPNTLPEQLRLSLNGKLCQWNLWGVAQYTRENFFMYKEWNVLQKEIPTARQAIYKDLHTRLQNLPLLDIWAALKAIALQINDGASVRETYRIMTEEELVALSQNNLIEIGAHTVTHPVLGALSREDQYKELEQSKHRLEAILNKPINTFAYPFGWRGIYTPETVSLVQKAGFELACANVPELVWQIPVRQGRNGLLCDRWQLPRILVHNWDEITFEHRLERLLNGWII